MAFMSERRVETDSMGEVRVPAGALYGASTQRAADNFPVSGMTMPRALIRSLGLLKRAAAQANRKLGQLDPELAQLVERAADEVAQGERDGEFIVDVFQTGSGTSTNMNANEVIANRCSQLAGEPLGSKRPVHPNDHVNRGQSSNDVMPAALHLSVRQAIESALVPALETLRAALALKAKEWARLPKSGRTHLMDATPVTMGQVFSGYARQVEKAVERARRASETLAELAIGGTAVGTGLNAAEGFAAEVCRILSADTGLAFREAANHFEAQGGRDDAVEAAGQLSAIAASLTKIANDIRLMGSGPRAGLAELELPATQPGSSIMPGKVNPVMSEMLVQVCHYVNGLCQCVSRCGQDGHFELNVTIPLIAHCLHASVECLSNGARLFAERCVEGLAANEAQCRRHVERSLMLVTALAPEIGYDKAAEAAKLAHSEGLTLKEAVLRLGLLEADAYDAALDPLKLARVDG